MGGDAGSHADGNSLRPIDQKVGNTHRQHFRLFLRLIKVGDKIDNVLVQILEERHLGKFGKSCLSVPHGSRPVSFYGAKVAVAVHKHHALLEVLGHDHQGLVDGAVPVRVVFTHGISHDTGAFSVGPVPADAQLMHIVESTSLDRLQPVPHIRESPGNDYAHGVVDI